MALEGDIRRLEQMIRKLEDQPDPDIGLASQIKDSVSSILRAYPEAAEFFQGELRSRVAWALQVAVTRKAATAAQALSAGLTEHARERSIAYAGEVSELRVQYGLPEVVASAMGEVDFRLMIAFRDFYEGMEKRRWIAWRAYKDFIILVGTAIKVRLSKEIYKNIQASFKKGGRLDDDIFPGDRTWPDLSEKYVKKNPRKRGKGRRSFGVLTGGMVRNIYREGALKIHWKGTPEQGAKEISLDFATTKAGKKLAMFYFGRSSGRGKQPARPFTFLRKKNMGDITKIVEVAFGRYVQANFSIFAGVRVGEMPAARTAPEFRLLQVWAAGGSERG